MDNGATPTEVTETVATEATSSEDTQQASVAEGSATEWQAKYEKAVAEAIAERKKRQQAESKVSEFEKAAMTDAERRAAEADEARKAAEEARTELRATRVEYAVRAKASEMGIVDPEAAYRLLDSSSFDPDDATALGKQVEAALTELVTRKPYLKGATNATSPANGQTRGAKVLSLDDLRALTEDEIAALWRERPDEVRAALKSQP